MITVNNILRNIPEINNPIDKTTIDLLEQSCIVFETRNSHSLALNSPLLGVVPINFTSIDRDMFFSILNADEAYLSNKIQDVDAISDTWFVLNDPFNQLVIYTAYRILNSTEINNQDKDRGLMSIFKLLTYKFFTSFIGQVFPHGTNKDIMTATIKGLSRKFDIVQLGTWKKVIESIAKSVFSPGDIHLNTLKNYNNDKSIFYVITDVRTRITSKIKLIQESYYDNHADENTLTSYGLTANVDGDKVILDTENVYDKMINPILLQVQTVSRFVDNQLIRALSEKYTFIKEEHVRQMLTIFSQTASLQVTSGTFEEFNNKSKKNEAYYTGLGAITRDLIQKTLRQCQLNNIPLNNTLKIINKAKDLFTSSRINDEEILTIKRSVYLFVINCDISRRDITNSALSIILILYILIKALSFI